MPNVTSLEETVKAKTLQTSAALFVGLGLFGFFPLVIFVCAW